MSTTKLTKLSHTILATPLFADREGDLLQVMVRTHDNPQGHWGRGWSIQNAMTAAAWLKTGDVVEVSACTQDAHCGSLSGALTEGRLGEIFVGKVTAQRDVKVTHRLEAAEA